jgi:hypothetical protein
MVQPLVADGKTGKLLGTTVDMKMFSNKTKTIMLTKTVGEVNILWPKQAYMSCNM